jgi:7-carboxy-7-deazaguanine synthase (Cx14CxxC type)
MAMTYTVKEIFYTLQGEGAQAGRPAVFCRFSGCNLWSGREIDREQAVCRFCDTEFVGTDGPGDGKFSSSQALADAIERSWGAAGKHRFVVFTGGEPLLQLNTSLIDAVHARVFEIAVETNGTLEPPSGIEWICVSPKAGAPWRLKTGQELKLIYPQPGLLPDDIGELQFRHFWVQPMDGPDRDCNTAKAIDYCLRNPRWRLGVQTHKLIGIR